MGIGRRIKEARIALNMTQEDLAKKLGITKGAVANYENETSHPKEPIMYKLIDVLEVDANYLFQDVVNIPRQKNDVTLAEYNHIKKYRDLDDHGKEMVDLVLEKEHARMTAAKVIPLSWPVEPPVTIAAHFEGDEFTEDELDEIREFAESVRNKGK